MSELSRGQREVLEQLQSGAFMIERYTDSRFFMTDRAWRIQRKINFQAATSLIARGFVELTAKDVPGARRFTISPAGEKALNRD